MLSIADIVDDLRRHLAFLPRIQQFGLQAAPLPQLNGGRMRQLRRVFQDFLTAEHCYLRRLFEELVNEPVERAAL
jgi:hypothetical protein